MNKSRIQSYILLVFLSLIWGSSFILMKKGLIVYSAGQVGSLRIVIAALIFLPLLLINRPKADSKKIKYILLFGLLEIGIPPFLFAFAQTVVDSSTAGILNGLTPLFTLLAGIMFFGVRYNFFKITGVLLGLAGAILLIFFKGSAEINLSNAFGLLIVVATILYGFAGNIIKDHLGDVPDFTITSLSFVGMGIPAAFYLFSTDFITLTFAKPDNLYSFFAITLLSIFGSALAIFLFSKLVKKSSALFASFVTYLIPFVALTWGFMDGEAISFSHIISLGVILGGITIANMGEKESLELQEAASE